MWLAAAIIAFTEGGAEGGAIARPPGVSSARGTVAPAPVAPALRKAAIVSVPIARDVVMPLRMKAMYRQARQRTLVPDRSPQRAAQLGEQPLDGVLVGLDRRAAA